MEHMVATRLASVQHAHAGHKRWARPPSPPSPPYRTFGGLQVHLADARPQHGKPTCRDPVRSRSSQAPVRFRLLACRLRASRLAIAPGSTFSHRFGFRFRLIGFRFGAIAFDETASSPNRGGGLVGGAGRGKEGGGLGQLLYPASAHPTPGSRSREGRRFRRTKTSQKKEKEEDEKKEERRREGEEGRRWWWW